MTGALLVACTVDFGPNDIGSSSGKGNGEFCAGGTTDVDALPMGTHFLTAMYAPRGFTTLDNNCIGYLGPVAQCCDPSRRRGVQSARGRKNIGYHGRNDTDPHGHCFFNTSQEETARKAIQGFLTKTEEPANFMEPKTKDANDSPVDVNLADYINRSTPTLN